MVDRNLQRAQRAAGAAEDALRRATMPLRNFGFPYRAPTVPRGVEVPPEVSGLGAHYDTEWARRPLASSVRTVMVEGPVRLAARVLASPEIRQQFGQKGRQKVLEDFSLTKMISCYEELFTDLLAHNLEKRE